MLRLLLVNINYRRSPASFSVSREPPGIRTFARAPAMNWQLGSMGGHGMDVLCLPHRHLGHFLGGITLLASGLGSAPWLEPVVKPTMRRTSDSRASSPRTAGPAHTIPPVAAGSFRSTCPTVPEFPFPRPERTPGHSVNVPARPGTQVDAP